MTEFIRIPLEEAGERLGKGETLYYYYNDPLDMHPKEETPDRTATKISDIELRQTFLKDYRVKDVLSCLYFDEEVDFYFIEAEDTLLTETEGDIFESLQQITKDT